jgi:hypothetical protein
MERNAGERIEGSEAPYVAMEAVKRRPNHLVAPTELEQEPRHVPVPPDIQRRAPIDGKHLQGGGDPSPHHHRCVAPTAELEGHRAAIRDTFGRLCPTNSSTSCRQS